MTALDARLDNASLVLEMYRTELAVACKANRDDHRFLSGVTHAQAALERVQRALDGETDPVRLGLADPETATVMEPESDLFGATA